MTTNAPLLEVKDLRVYFRAGSTPIRAVDGASFSIRAGETVALVGESGCGKSVTALALTRLVPEPGYVAGGEILFRGRNVLGLNTGELRKLRGAEISYVFQEPGTSLNPVFRVGYQIAEAVKLHRKDVHARTETLNLMQMVGLPNPERLVRAYPHELSGGMQQRVMIAIALACQPKLLVADEPTTALDVTIQAQILELLVSLQKQFHMAVLLITHNLGLVADVAHWVNVMYAGRIAESGPTGTVLRSPVHPYTRALLDAVPRLTGDRREMGGIEGTVPGAERLPQGCPFGPRCSRADDRCRAQDPAAARVEGEHWVRCHYWK